MGIKVLAVAAVMALGFGRAEAASVKYDLRYEDTVLDEAVIWDSETGDLLWDFLESGPLSVHNALWDLSAFQTGERKGDITDAYLEYEEYLDFGDSGYGYIAPVCWVGSFNCEVQKGERVVWPELFHVATDSFVVERIGSSLHATTWGLYDGDGFSISGNGYEGSAASITSIYTIVELAPVPLPASVALLPLGIGALAMMRRRRRSV